MYRSRVEKYDDRKISGLVLRRLRRSSEDTEEFLVFSKAAEFLGYLNIFEIKFARCRHVRASRKG
jgi:hypothetical protein